MPTVHLASDCAFTGLKYHLCDLRDWNKGAIAGRQDQVPDRLGIVARRWRKADGRVVSPFANEHLAYGIATNPGLDQIRNVRDVDSVTGGGRAVNLDGDLRQRRLLVNRHVCRPGCGFEDVDDFFCDAAQLVDIVAEDLDDELAVGAGDLVVDPVDHGLAETYIKSWHFMKPVRHARDQIPFGFAGGPSVVGVKADACFDMRWCPRISTFVVSP